MSISVLIAEDEPRVRSFISKGLEQRGFQVHAVESFRGIDDALLEANYDVLILDRLFGTADSITKVSQLRSDFPESKILILSALSEVDQRVRGLEAGADDYLGKPFHMEELVARVRTLVRRKAVAPASSLKQFEDIRLDQ